MISIHSKDYSSIQSPVAASTRPGAPAATNARFADQFQELSQPPAATPNSVVSGPEIPELKSTASPAPEQAVGKTSVSAAVKNFIEWQSAQPNPIGQGTIADIWAKQGITDPMSNPLLISQAETQLNRAEQRSAMNPNYVAEWKGDWKTLMADSKAAENQRQTLMAAADALGKVTVGGGFVSMVG